MTPEDLFKILITILTVCVVAILLMLFAGCGSTGGGPGVGDIYTGDHGGQPTYVSANPDTLAGE